MILKKRLFLFAVIILFVSIVGGGIMERMEYTQAQAKSSKVGTVSGNDVYVLSKIIAGEARGEPFIGQVAVGAVIANRVRNPNFPNSVYGVVFEPGAFTAVSDGQYYRAPTASSVKAARSAISGWDPSGGAIYYWNPATATSKWIWSRRIITRIGKHVFGL
jgi:N-acetylmuramoyl-L-alanine amidase